MEHRFTWSECTLRQYLNNDFYTTNFTGQERAIIAQTHLSNPDNTTFETLGGADTDDYLFLLSIYEVNHYFLSDNARVAYQDMTQAQIENAADRIAPTYGLTYSEALRMIIDWDGTAGRWWLRSPGAGDFNQSGAAVVDSDGGVDDVGSTVDQEGIGVRPALWLKL